MLTQFVGVELEWQPGLQFGMWLGLDPIWAVWAVTGAKWDKEPPKTLFRRISNELKMT